MFCCDLQGHQWLLHPVSSPQVTPQSTPHTAGSVGLPATTFDTPCTSKRMSYSRRPASPASTVDSLDMLDGVSELDGTPLIHERERLHKMEQPPTYDDCPVNASAEELEKWK